MVRVNKETGLPSGLELCHSKTLESDLTSHRLDFLSIQQE